MKIVTTLLQLLAEAHGSVVPLRMVLKVGVYGVAKFAWHNSCNMCHCVYTSKYVSWNKCVACNMSTRISTIQLLQKSMHTTWYVGCFVVSGFTGLSDGISVYTELSPRKGRKKMIGERKIIQTTITTPTASRVDPCPSLERPGTKSYLAPSTDRNYPCMLQGSPCNPFSWIVLSASCFNYHYYHSSDIIA